MASLYRGSSARYNFGGDYVPDVGASSRQYNLRANVGHDVGGSFVQPNLGDHNVHDENVDVERMPDHSADSHVNQERVDSEQSCDEEHEDNNDDDNDSVGISDFDEMYNEQGRENTSQQDDVPIPPAPHMTTDGSYRLRPIIPFFSMAYAEIPVDSSDVPVRRSYYDPEKGVLEKGMVFKDKKRLQVCVKDYSAVCKTRSYRCRER
ncbi:hypothetical protein DH2020_043194 [Rehmannia glutinosa]|uniref:Transposase MuDR plant domain-containing protein n=1 Tax=Rehmannia glutinosa TaxID=99300 RepID=A0ABR0ULH0_REHGL